MIDPAARARLEWWKSALLDLTTGNRLLDTTPGRTCLALPDIDALELASIFADGVDLGAGEAAGLFGHRLQIACSAGELARRLVTIERAARSYAADRGEHALWLALGTLVWRDAEHVAHAAPLALVPVELDGHRVVVVDGAEVEPNAVLAEKLRRDFGLTWAPPPALASIFESAEGIALMREGWQVDRAVRLGCFALGRFRQWRDLETRGDAVLASPVVAHLARCGGEDVLGFAQPSTEAAGLVTSTSSNRGAAWSTELLAPLDADASQLQAVAAAGAGASFVLQAPPGTGATQTIANLIVHCAAAGKSVLVASQEVSALDAIQQRLASVGLGDFCLELARSADRKDRRARVVAQLGRVLERTFRPGSGPVGDERSRELVQLEQQIDHHAETMHHTGPFGRSLHAVLGRLVELRTAPRALLADPDAIGLEAATFERRRAAIATLAAAAVEVEPVAHHPWRASRLGAWPGAESVLAAIDEATAAASELQAALRELATLVPGIVARSRAQLLAIGTMARLASKSPRPGGELLTHLRAAHADDLGEQIALVRARGGGAVEVPRDPLAFLALAERHRALVAEVAETFVAADELDAPALWTQLRKWTHSVAPVRFVALRNVRAELKAASMPLDRELADAAMVTALEAVIAERACRTALASATEPARRWFGQLAGTDPLDLELASVDAAVAWAADLRRAFDAVDVAFGDTGRNAAWRSLVAQVAAGPTGTSDGSTPALFARLADAVDRWAPAIEALAAATGIPTVELAPDPIAASRDGEAIDSALPSGGLRAPAKPGLAIDSALPSGGLRAPAMPGLAIDDHLAALRERAETLRHALASAPTWVAFHVAREQARVAGLGPAVHAIERGDLDACDVALAWERATLLAWAEAERASASAAGRSKAIAGASAAGRNTRNVDAELEDPLAAFPGAAHHALVAAYADLDRASLALVRSRALARFAERVPARRRGSSPPDAQEVDELAPLLDELARTRVPGARKSEPVVHRPLRELFAAMPTALTRIAPCLLVTPASAAQYLPSDIRFDVVVIDAASQLPVAEAIGLLARGESAVIVGDRCQVPVTHHFDGLRQARLPDDELPPSTASAVASEIHDAVTAPASVAEDDLAVCRQSDDADSDTARMRQAASLTLASLAAGAVTPANILDECLRARLPELRLVCHYRSRHEDLFAFANERYYGDRLQMFAAAANSPDLGIAWRKTDRADDRLEAEGVVAEILVRLADPAQRTRSLGVVTLSRAQQELVEDLLDAARASDPALAAQWSSDRLRHGVADTTEPVVVRPVDGALGLERDVVLLMLGTLDGLAADEERGGHALEDLGRRRLATAITRAREQLVVFASVDIPDLDDRAPGPSDLAALLAFARDGGLRPRLMEGAEVAASPITEAFARALVERGWTVRHQVGCGAYKIDLAIVDPGDPERYVLAIEHDGAAFASAPAARDRERLRGQMLAQLGWRVHRFWTLDWWNDPEREIQRAHTAIVTAIAAARQRRAQIAPVRPRPRVATPVAVAPAAVAAESTGTLAVPAREVTLPTLATGSRPVRIARNAIPIGPYTAAAIPPGRRTPDDLFAPRHLAELGKVVEQVLAAEAPMHVELLARRVGAYFGIGRVTQHVTSQIRAVLDGRGKLGGDEPDVVWRLDQDPETIPPVRVAPGPGGSPMGRRDIAEIPLSELAAAARIVVERSNAIGTAELVRDAARLMGFARVTDLVTERVAQAVRLAQLRELIAIENNRCSVPAADA